MCVCACLEVGNKGLITRGRRMGVEEVMGEVDGLNKGYKE